MKKSHKGESMKSKSIAKLESPSKSPKKGSNVSKQYRASHHDLSPSKKRGLEVEEIDY